MKNIFFFALIFVSIHAKSQIDDNLSALLQNVLNDRVSSLGDHGVSAYLIMEDGNVWAGQAGVGGNSQVITETTVFHGASTTKTHVATLTLLLAEEGLIDLDEPWTTYLTVNPGFDPNITIRQLLGHTSGIADYLETASSGAYILDDPSHAFTGEEIILEVVGTTPDFLPGTSFNYSNSNYALLGLVVEAVTGNTVYLELRNRIWTPLGLEHTYFGGFEPFSEEEAGVWWNFGSGLNNYSTQDQTSMLTFGFCAGNIVSTPHDEAAFLQALLAGQLVNAASLSEMQNFSSASYSSWTAGYGLGLHHAISTGVDEVLGHDGYYTNLTSMFHSTTFGFTLVTMTNTQTDWYGIFLPMYQAVVNFVESSTVEQQANTLQVYPNPCSDLLYVENAPSGKGVIMDVFGKVVQELLFQGGTRAFEVSKLPSGCYFIRVGTRTFPFVKSDH